MAAHSTYKLPESCDLLSADRVKNDLLEALTAGSTIVVDASNVIRMSSAVVQILIAAKTHANSEKGSLSIGQTSDSFSQALKTLGAESLMMEEQNA